MAANRVVFRFVGLLLLACGGIAATAPGDLVLHVDAPASLEAVARRIRRIDRSRLADALARAGLDSPQEATITLLPDDHALARAAPAWVVAQAFGSRAIVIFPARVGTYPNDSLESVVWHEVVHLALTLQAGGGPLPRWFHEGVAVSVEEGWDTGSRLRLLLAAIRDPELAELGRLFAADAQPENASAYLLATALVSDVRRRHGSAVPGAIATRVAKGIPFDQAFVEVTGETPAAAATRAWRAYRRWTSWIPLVTSASAVWLGILVLSLVAFVASRRASARRRRRWEEEEGRTSPEDED